MHRRKHKKKRSPAAATVIWFALTFARHILRQKRVHPSSKLHRAMLNPYHGLLHRCLSITRDNQVLQASLRTLGLLMPLQLPGLSTSTPQIANSVFRLLQSSAGGAGQSVGVGGRKRGARSDLGEAAIRTFTLMLRHCHDLKVSDEQLAAVLSLVRLDLDVPARQNATFAVIKVLQHRVPLVLVCVSCGCSATVRYPTSTGGAAAQAGVCRAIRPYGLHCDAVDSQRLTQREAAVPGRVPAVLAVLPPGRQAAAAALGSLCEEPGLHL